MTALEDEVLAVLRRVGGHVTRAEVGYQLRRRRPAPGAARVDVALAGLNRAGLITEDERGRFAAAPQEARR